MRTRTRLTSPPNQEPAPTSGAPDGEPYTAALRTPTEPHVPSRSRRLWVMVATAAALVVVVYLGFQLLTSGQQFDPALDTQFAPSGTTSSSTAPSPAAPSPDGQSQGPVLPGEG